MLGLLLATVSLFEAPQPSPPSSQSHYGNPIMQQNCRLLFEAFKFAISLR